MLFNITDVLTTEGKVLKSEANLEVNEYSFQGSTFPIVRKTPVSLKLVNEGKGKLAIDGDVKLDLLLNCDRCLQEVPYVMDVSFAKHIQVPYPEDGDGEEDQSFVEGHHLNIEQLVYNEILMNWPMKVLCKEECKGICPECGCNLNEETCKCDTFVPDPRMAVIKDVFNANKEV